mmetsp:Transcript_12749/g.46633  ORF Transcript_12749/g.46633 Transcript_12749/m.46633 type:complete len:878 (+) Transcript_12749:157-2790(+)
MASDRPVFTERPIDFKYTKRDNEEGGCSFYRLCFPEVAKFQETILRWNFYKLIEEEEAEFESVPKSFRSADQYLEVFRPLVIEECRAIIYRGSVQNAKSHRTLCAELNQVNNFEAAKLAVESSVQREYRENDLILLCREPPETSVSEPSQHSLGIVVCQVESHYLKVRFFLPLGVDQRIDSVRDDLRLTTKDSRGWFIQKVCNLSTVLREYLALYQVKWIKFSKLLVTGDPEGYEITHHADGRVGVPAKLKHALTKAHNPSQLQAIMAGLSSSPLVLIQGPPGTGKTQTIVGLISVVIHSDSRYANVDYTTTSSFAPSGLTMEEKKALWRAASPWLTGSLDRGFSVSARSRLLASSEYSIGIESDPKANMIDPNGVEPSAPKDCKLTRAAIGNDMAATIVNRALRKSRRILVTAPSNAAVDELAMRLLSQGVLGADGIPYTPSVVRVGLSIHPSLEHISLDSLVEKRRSEISSRRGHRDMDQHQLRSIVMEEAMIIFSTLSYSGSTVFGKLKNHFDVVIIDEAAQAVESSVLVPLCHGCTQVFLVGDPKQLPATILSNTAAEAGYNRSMFQRFQEAGYPVHMLRTQYRMHPKICTFPSSEFYDGKLESDEGVVSETSRVWHEHASFGPFALYNICDSKESRSGASSWSNLAEAKFLLNLYLQLSSAYPQDVKSNTVGIISPYQGQVDLLKKLFKERLGSDILRELDINTVDGFQGREKDVIMFSCVRSSPYLTGRNAKSEAVRIGFLQDKRRMNVGLTRARASMLVICNVETLRVNKAWKHLIEHAKQQNCIFSITQAQVHATEPKRATRKEYVDLRELKPSPAHVTAKKRGREQTRTTRKRSRQDSGTGTYEDGKDEYYSDLGSDSEDEAAVLGIE